MLKDPENCHGNHHVLASQLYTSNLEKNCAKASVQDESLVPIPVSQTSLERLAILQIL